MRRMTTTLALPEPPCTSNSHFELWVYAWTTKPTFSGFLGYDVLIWLLDKAFFIGCKAGHTFGGQVGRVWGNTWHCGGGFWLLMG